MTNSFVEVFIKKQKLSK